MLTDCSLRFLADCYTVCLAVGYPNTVLDASVPLFGAFKDLPCHIVRVSRSCHVTCALSTKQLHYCNAESGIAYA